MANFEWPLQPNGQPVPSHRKSWVSNVEGYPVFCASSWTVMTLSGKRRGHWKCGYCQRWTSDPLSPDQQITLADCDKCGKTNRISL